MVPDPQEEDPTGGRVGGVDLEKVELIRSPDLDQSPRYRSLTRQLDSSKQVLESLRKRGFMPLERRLRDLLDKGVRSGRYDGALIATMDGLVVAESSRLPQGDLFACLGTGLEDLERRLRDIPDLEGPVRVRLEDEMGRSILWHRLPPPSNQCVLLAMRLKPSLGSQITGNWARWVLQPLEESLQDWLGRKAMAKTAHLCSQVLHEALAAPGTLP